MARHYDEKSILKTQLIKKVLLNEKNYKFQDFKFKVLKDVITNKNKYWQEKDSYIEVYNYDKLILKIRYVILDDKAEEEKFGLSVIYFNPQTNNDCQSINHIMATFSSLCCEQHRDRGNACVINNEYAFRKKENFYSFTRVWARGDIKQNNHDKDLSYEFATEEYINYIKKIFGFKRMPRRDLKKKIKSEIEDAINTENKRLILESLETKR